MSWNVQVRVLRHSYNPSTYQVCSALKPTWKGEFIIIFKLFWFRSLPPPTHPSIRSNAQTETLVEPPVVSLSVQHHPSVVVQLSWVIRVVLVSVIIQRHKERGTLHSVKRRLVQSLREELLTGLRPFGPIPSRQTGHHLLSRQWSGLVVQDVLQLHLDLTRAQQSVAVVNEDLVEAALVINYDMIRVLKGKRGKTIQKTSS